MKYYTVLLVNAFFAVALAQKAFNSQKQQQQYQQQPQQQQQYQQQPQQQQQQKQVVVESKYRNIPIVQLENTQDHDGSFKYSFEDGEGTKVQQNGQLKYVNQESAGEAVQGGYSYTVSDTIV
jgi:Insect cuticle protein